MPEPEMPIDFSHSLHRALIIAMQGLGYQKEISGVCFGLSHMAMQAIFSNDIYKFNARIERIKELSTAFLIIKAKLLAECNLDIQPNDWKQLSKDFFELLSPTGKVTRTKIIDGLEITTTSNKDPLILDLETKFKARINKIMDVLPLEEKVDLMAFFDSLSIYQNPPGWTSATSQLDLKRSMPFALNALLETQGGFSKIQQMDGIYSKSDLTEFLTSFRKSLTVKTSTPIMISMCDINHAISVSYHPDKQEWSFIDANQLPIISLKEEAEIAEKILLGFSPDLKMPNAITLHSEILATNLTHNILRPCLETWQHSPDYLKLHTASPSKAKMVDAWQIPWLYNACQSLNIETVQALLGAGTDPNPLFRMTNFQELFPSSLNSEQEKAITKLLLKYHAIPDKYQYQILQHSNDPEMTSLLEPEDVANKRYAILTYARQNINNGFNLERSERDKAFQELAYLCKKTQDVSVIEKKQIDLQAIHTLEKKLNSLVGWENKSFNTIMDDTYKEYVNSCKSEKNNIFNNFVQALTLFATTLPKPSKIATFFGKRDIGRDVQAIIDEEINSARASNCIKKPDPQIRH